MIVNVLQTTLREDITDEVRAEVPAVLRRTASAESVSSASLARISRTRRGAPSDMSSDWPISKCCNATCTTRYT
jgi:hypothetical protein